MSSKDVHREDVKRYSRQILLKEIGGAGQKLLQKSRVLIIGAGGLGGPCGLYLAAAGVDTLGLVDDDVVELSNLHRQIQFGTPDIGRSKTTSMKARLGTLNAQVNVAQHAVRLDDNNAQSIIKNYDLVLDGCDNFETRFAVNATCLKLNIPLVSGALGRFDGQLSAFKNDGNSACYRCYVPQIPKNIESCSAVGVLGAMAGIIGSMMALEAMKIITGAGDVLYSRLFIFDGLQARARTINLPRDPACPACADL